MSTPLKEYVQQVMSEHGRGWKILQALHFGNDAVLADADSSWWRRKSTRRGVFWENAVNKVIELTADDPQRHIVQHYDTVSLIFEDAVLVRLKKASIALRTSNYPTPQAQMFHDHEADLFGYTGLQRVEAVYIPNRFDTGIVWAGIVAREKNIHLWHFELVAPVVVPVTPLPKPVTPSTETLARLRNQANDDTAKKDEGKD